jgi:leucyl aminopeptidase
MNVILHSGPASTVETPLLAVPVLSDDSRGAIFDAVNERTGGRLARIAEEEHFKGKSGQSLLVHCETPGLSRVLLYGVGKQADLKATAARAIAAAAVSQANKRHLSAVAVCIPAGVDTQAATAFAAQGAALGGYRFDHYLTQDVEELTCGNLCIVGGASDSQGLVDRTLAAAAGVTLARDLVNGPPVQVTPTYMADSAQKIADESGLECKIFDKADLEREGMNLLLAVSAGSDEEPRLIHLTYRPEGADENTPEIALVGKGLTFDAGGYNLKPTGSIEDMKMDMAGGAAVLGAMKAVKAFAPNVIVHGIVPSSENLVSGGAYKVGDIFHSLNGKSVQVMNTDAEGRLILADALCYTERLGVDKIVDLATLTGACMVALGPYTAGLFSDHDDFANAIERAAENAGENVWRMPLQKKLKPMLKSPIADMKNVGQRWGGAITAGLFLQEFVGDTTWAHLDIAGPAYADKADEHVPKGGTGFAVLTLLELVSGEL